MEKGQFRRLFLSKTSNAEKVIAAAKELTLHLSATVEDSSTKDTTGDWVEQEITALSYDISSQSIVIDESDSLATSANGLKDLESYWEDGDKLYWLIATVSGTNNRTKGTTLVSGRAHITSLSIDAANKQNSTVSASLQGFGEIVIPSTPSTP